MRLRGRRCCSRAMVQSKKNCNVGSTKQSNNNSNKLHILIFIEDWSMKYTAHKSTTGEHSALVGKLENYNFPFLLCSYNFLYIMLLCFGCFFSSPLSDFPKSSPPNWAERVSNEPHQAFNQSVICDCSIVRRLFDGVAQWICVGFVHLRSRPVSELVFQFCGCSGRDGKSISSWFAVSE